jgi:broad specificity phosphatase PhoE
MKLFFIRHGETTGDVEDRYGGAYDDVLSPEGERQVEQLVSELQDRGIQKIFSSPLKRARQTAEGLASAIGCEVIVIDNLRERSQYGPLTGMVKAEAKAQYPDLVKQVKDRLNTLPAAESYSEASERTTAAYHDVLAQAGPCAAVVWHGGGMRVLFRDILQMGELNKIGDCCWVELTRSNDDFFVVGDSQRIEMDF